MPQLVNVTLNNGTEDIVYTPQQIVGNVASLIDPEHTIMGTGQLSNSVRRSATRRKTTVKLQVPVLGNETVNGMTREVVLHKSYATVEFDFAIESTTADRTSFRNMLISALKDTSFVATIDKNESLY